MTVAVCLSVFPRIGFSWAPNAIGHQESQGDDELLTPPRASLGHCSAGKIWQMIQPPHGSSLRGGEAGSGCQPQEQSVPGNGGTLGLGWLLGSLGLPSSPVPSPAPRRVSHFLSSCGPVDESLSDSCQTDRERIKITFLLGCFGETSLSFLG